MSYNILNNLLNIDSDAYFKRSKHTRGNNMKLNKSHASSVRHMLSHFFTHRVINVWNSLIINCGKFKAQAPLFEFYATMLRFFNFFSS